MEKEDPPKMCERDRPDRSSDSETTGIPSRLASARANSSIGTSSEQCQPKKSETNFVNRRRFWLARSG